ncbi:MAG: polysaccharide deacetylase family protein [Lachnospiraceae bacterium]|nr:polysaccharide deacetylase family protein [Lachnospiraceae bacterium]
MSKRTRIIIVAVALAVAFAAMVTPVKNTLEDGGTVEYKAILYRYTKYNTVVGTEKNGTVETGRKTGSKLQILGLTVRNKTEIRVEGEAPIGAPTPSGKVAANTPTPTIEPTNPPTPTNTPTPTPTPSPLEKIEATRAKLLANVDYYNSLDNTSERTWQFIRMKDHTQSGTREFMPIADYGGFYVDKSVTDDDKVIYLTFDCGYPSDKTVKILDTLKKHNAKASFFVTKMYLEKCSDYAIRMKQEGHAVCNHTVSHSDLRTMPVEKIVAEILDVAEYFYNKTGYEFDPFFRTPSGSYTVRLLTLIRDAGYRTVFWSIAYGDYDKNNPPAPGYVTNHFKTYYHNGAVALMHNDCQQNADELDAVLTFLEGQGYRFALLDEVP